MQEAKFRPHAAVMSHQLNTWKDSVPSADQDKQSDQRNIRFDSWTSAASSSPYNRSSSSWGLEVEHHILNAEAQKFWKETFIGQGFVDVKIFSRALRNEFAFVEKKAEAMDLILLEMDVDIDGVITLTDFNVFTKKLGLEGACRNALSKHAKPTPPSSTLAAASSEPVATAAGNQSEVADVYSQIKIATHLERKTRVTYIGKGKFLGGDKSRTGFLRISGNASQFCFILEKEVATENYKINENIMSCQVDKSGDSALGVVASGSSTVITFGHQNTRDEWISGITSIQQLIKTGEEKNKTRFYSSNIKMFLGPTQVSFECVEMCLGNKRSYVVAKKPLDGRHPYFEVLSRGNGLVGLGLCCSTPRKGIVEGMPGWNPDEIGYHGDDGHLYEGKGSGKPLGKKFGAGDRVGCGVLFKDTGAKTVYFVVNGSVVGVVPFRGEIFPVVAGNSDKDDFARLTRVDILLEISPPSQVLASVEAFTSRILVHGAGNADAFFGDLSAALAYANAGQTVTLSPGTYLLPRTIVVDKAVTIKGQAGASDTKVCAGEGCGEFMFQIKEKVSISDLTMQGTADCSVLSHEQDININNCRMLFDMSSKEVPEAAGTYGGCVVVSFSGILKCSKCVIGPCKTCGIVLCNMSGKTPSQIAISDTNFIRCGTNGIECEQRGATLSVKDCQMDKCGLGIRCTGPSKLSLQGSKIVGNSSRREFSENCTGLYIAQGSEADVSGCTFTEHWRAILVKDANTKLTGKDCSVQCCKGSGITAQDEKALVKLESCRIKECGLHALEDDKFRCAGITVTKGAIAHLDGCHFTKCVQSAILATDNGVIIYKDSKIELCPKSEVTDSGARIQAL